jgi:hypothetical protein
VLRSSLFLSLNCLDSGVPDYLLGKHPGESLSCFVICNNNCNNVLGRKGDKVTMLGSIHILVLNKSVLDAHPSPLHDPALPHPPPPRRSLEGERYPD